MYLATSAEMKFLDRIAIERFGIPGIVLMENAAQSVAKTVLDFWADWPPSPLAAVLIGVGQNGGDGWAVARILSTRGFEVRCFLVKSPGREVAGDAAINMAIAEKLGLPIEVIDSEDNRLPNWQEFDLLIDAIFGTGLDRPVSGPAAAVLKSAGLAKKARGEGLRVLAVDMPSGLSGDSGEMLCPGGLPADVTVTLGAPKVGLYLRSGPPMAGKVVLGDIGLSDQMFALAPPLGRLSSPAELPHNLPPRPIDGHKGTFGHVLVAGGAKGKTGALVLAANGALRSGAALVTALYPASLSPIYETKLTEAMGLDLPEDEPGEFSAGAGDLILEYGPGRQALALGTGMGLGEGAVQTVRKVVEGIDLPVVLDADALTLLNGDLGKLKRLKKVLITPHPGEAARLLNVTTNDIQKNRLAAARQLASDSGAVVVLKGHNSIITEPEGSFYLNTTGGNHMAVGGCGDLLTGLLAGLLAQGMEPFKAAILGVWVHGRAADLAKKEIGPFGLTPTEMADRLPQVWRELLA